MTSYDPILMSDDSTIVSEYQPTLVRESGYQSEADLEAELIETLRNQGYEFLSINDEAGLVPNLRLQLEKLNHIKFTDGEWEAFFNREICLQGGIVEKTARIQQESAIAFTRANGSKVNLKLIDRDNIHNNSLQVIHQYETEGRHSTRYDVSILVNGLPLVHIELKRRGVSIKEAFNQINRYQRDSFWADSGLFEYVQIFVISNGAETKYYSNTTRSSHIKEVSPGTRRRAKTSHTFEFTSYWTDGKNKVIADLVDFSRTFFAKHTILNVLTKYCVFDTDDKLLVMRPYQIAATERILQRINVSNNYKQMGGPDAGGYIWHTTGSGKTLTSFKTAQLATRFDFVDKVLFVVDRKDLDYQTMREYERFEKGCANSNTNTAVLTRQLEDRNERGAPNKYRIIVTTIQKLSQFIKKNRSHPVYRQHLVLIFDECHRSQFGEMHEAIVRHFRNYHIFGFTGTPIFAQNAPNAGRAKQSFEARRVVPLKTTEQTFGQKLHSYTIVDAIRDGNVLPFRIDYVNTLREKAGIKDAEISAIDAERALRAPQRIENVVGYIFEHYDQKTRRNEAYYSFRKTQNIAEISSDKTRTVKAKTADVRLNGFNSIFAVDSIEMLKQYYLEFAKRNKALPPERRLKVATIYSYGVNEDDSECYLGEENSEDTSGLDKSSRDFLDDAIKDYNKLFRTNFSTDGDKFQNYYKDVSLRMKNREIDILLVVNMFLTGFDATTLNTLWVDKNLRMHGLLQAFSRTNRILNSVKTYGNIVCFRDLQAETEQAISLFGDENASSIVILKDFASYYDGYDDGKGHHPGYLELVGELQSKFPPNEMIVGEKREKEFIALFNAILRLRNILVSFDDFWEIENKEPAMSERDFQNHESHYHTIHDKWRNRERADKENINDDLVFEMELIRQIEVNIDYILMLVEKYHKSHCKNKEILTDIRLAVDSSMQLRSKRELIESFINTVNAKTDVCSDWEKFVKERKESDLQDLIREENLRPEEKVREFVDGAFRDGELKTTGTDIDKFMPPMSRFGNADGLSRSQKKKNLIEKLKAFFAKYSGL